MMTYRTGVAGAPSAAKAMASHLLESTLSPEQMRAAEYYTQGRGIDEAIAAGLGCAPTPRAGVDPRVAEALGIDPSRFLTEVELANVLQGRRADGAELPGSQRDIRKYSGAEKTRGRIAYMDLTVSAPKSASVAWAFARTAAEQNSILQAHRDARDEMLRYIEQEIGHAGFGKGHREAGGARERAYFVWITCDHFTARQTIEITRADPQTGVMATELHTVRGRRVGAPQLHSHCLLPNLMVTESGRIVSIDRDLLKGRVHEFGGIYQAALARNLRALGIDVERCQRTGMAKLTAIPEWVCEEFSPRTRDGEEVAKKQARDRGLDWDTMSDDARIAFVKGSVQDLKLAKSRGPEFCKDDLANVEEWRSRIAGRWEHSSAIAYGPYAPALSHAERMEGAFQTGIPLFEESLAKEAVVEAKHARLAMIGGLIEWGMESTSDLKALTREMVSRGVRQDGDKWTTLIWREDERGRVKMTTELHADQERELISRAQAGHADTSRALTLDEIAAAIGRTGLTFEGEHGAAQRDTIERVGTGGAVGAFVGVAGVGKTSRIIPVLVEAWKARGYDVWGTADAWIQANALQETGIDNSRTWALKPFLERLQDGRTTLGPGSVVVLDELSRIGTRELLRLLRAREHYGFQLVLTGSERQCQAIEAGPVIELLRRALGEDAIPEILTTVRQRSAEERHVAGLFHDGKIAEAMGIKRANGSAELVEGGYRQCVQRVAELYVARRRAVNCDPDYRITISAPTNADALEISRMVRLARREMGEVGEDRMQIQASDPHGNAFNLPLAEGDKVRLYRRTRATFITEAGRRQSAWIGDNGSVRDVVEIRSDGLRLRGESGKVGFVTWDALRDRDTKRVLLTYGDCRTIDGSQGIDSHEHIDAMPSGSVAVHGFQAYVAESRSHIASWFVGSMGAEMYGARERRPLGMAEQSAAERSETAWAHVVQNLSRQPAKESALAFLASSAESVKRSARALQAGLRVHEARAAAGQPATTLRRTNQYRQASKSVAQARAEVTASLDACAAYLENREQRRMQMAATMVAEGMLPYGEAQNRLISAILSEQTRGAPRDNIHGLPARIPGTETADRVEARVANELAAAVERVYDATEASSQQAQVLTQQAVESAENASRARQNQSPRQGQGMAF